MPEIRLMDKVVREVPRSRCEASREAAVYRRRSLVSV